MKKGEMDKFGIAGLLAPILFLATYLTMSSVRPEYSHLTKAISELGSVDAPNRWWFNILGYFLVGAMISFFAIGLRKCVNPDGKGRLAFYGLFLSGVFMGLSGVFPGDFDNRTSTTMILHTIVSFGSFAFFLLAAFSYPTQFKKSDYWGKAVISSLVLTGLCIISGFLRTGNAPGLGQRIGFLFYFLWVGYLAYMLLKKGEKE